MSAQARIGVDPYPGNYRYYSPIYMRKPDPTTATTIDIVQRYPDAFNKGDINGVKAP